MDEESKAGERSFDLSYRLKPQKMTGGGLKLGGKKEQTMASTGTLRPRGLMGSASSAALQSATLGRKDLKSELGLDNRGLAKSRSAAILGRRPYSPVDKTFGPGDMTTNLGSMGDSFAVDPPRAPGSEDSMVTKKYDTFLDSLGLSAADLHALYNVPNTFFYMRMKGISANNNGSSADMNGATKKSSPSASVADANAAAATADNIASSGLAGSNQQMDESKEFETSQVLNHNEGSEIIGDNNGFQLAAADSLTSKLEMGDATGAAGVDNVAIAVVLKVVPNIATPNAVDEGSPRGRSRGHQLLLLDVTGRRD